MNDKKSICVLCGREWLPVIKNLCECGGFCTWGFEPNKPESFTVDAEGNWHLKPIPMIEKKSIKLSDIKVNLPFNIQKNMYIGHLMDWKDGIHKYGYKVDFDVFLPTKGINLQRDFCWTIEQKQELILSVIKGVDIQTFTVIIYIEDSIKRDTTIKFIDGKQRFSTLLDFIQDKFPVKLLGESYLYSELPKDIKDVIDHFDIHFNQTYEYQDDLISDDMKIAWFEQINFAGTPQDIEHLNRLKSDKKIHKSICSADKIGAWCLGCEERNNCKLYRNNL